MSDALREAAQQALDALESLQGGCTDSGDGTVEAITVWCPEIINALRAALAQPTPQVAASFVPMPTTEAEAAGMALVGTAWLEQHAPHRLKATSTSPQAAPTVPEWRPIETAPDDGRDALVYRPLAKNTGSPDFHVDSFLAMYSLALRIIVWKAING